MNSVTNTIANPRQARSRLDLAQCRDPAPGRQSAAPAEDVAARRYKLAPKNRNGTFRTRTFRLCVLSAGLTGVPGRG